MPRTRLSRQLARLLSAGLLLALSSPIGATPAQSNDKRASLALRARPQVAIAPARVFVSAEIRGGAPDAEDLYCPTVEWDWGDGTRSTASADCDPYAAGTSEIQRRYSMTKVYREPGRHRVQLRLMQGNRIALSGTTVVHVREGLPGPVPR